MIVYKCFNKDLTDRYGNLYETNKIYHIDGNIIFGKSGYHSCKNLEDTLRFFNPESMSICLVNIFGNIKGTNRFEDDYYGYYDMYTSSDMMIIKKLTHEEVIEYGKHLHGERAIRFIRDYKLSTEEVNIFLDLYKDEIDVYEAIIYYYIDRKVYYKKYLRRSYGIK